jgi:hypothetical protein
VKMKISLRLTLAAAFLAVQINGADPPPSPFQKWLCQTQYRSPIMSGCGGSCGPGLCDRWEIASGQQNDRKSCQFTGSLFDSCYYAEWPDGTYTQQRTFTVYTCACYRAWYLRCSCYTVDSGYCVIYTYPTQYDCWQCSG